MSEQIFWYITRSAALISWLAAAAAMLSGLLTSSRLLGRRPTIPWLVDLHRYLSAMSIVFLVVHMATLWLDPFVAFRFGDLLVPWQASVPGLSGTSLALGVLAAWLVALVQVTSYLKDRMPPRTWRTIHLGSYGVLVMGTIHAIQTGSDVGNPIVLGIGVSMLAAVTAATAGRIIRYRQHSMAAPSSAITTTSRHDAVATHQATPSVQYQQPHQTQPNVPILQTDTDSGWYSDRADGWDMDQTRLIEPAEPVEAGLWTGPSATRVPSGGEGDWSEGQWSPRTVAPPQRQPVEARRFQPMARISATYSTEDLGIGTEPVAAPLLFSDDSYGDHGFGGNERNGDHGFGDNDDYLYEYAQEPEEFGYESNRSGSSSHPPPAHRAKRPLPPPL